MSVVVIGRAHGWQIVVRVNHEIEVVFFDIRPDGPKRATVVRNDFGTRGFDFFENVLAQFFDFVTILLLHFHKIDCENKGVFVNQGISLICVGE